MEKPLQKFLALILVLCCMTGLVQPAAATGTALPAEHFQVHMVNTSGTDILGSFLKQGSSVFVEVGTLKAMQVDVEACYSDGGDSILVYRNMQPEDFLLPNQDIQSIEFTANHTIVNDKGVFVPFLLTMEILGLNPVVDEAGKRLMITNAGNVDQLAVVMEEIYQEPCYDMRYWKNSENFRRDVAMAEMVGAFRDLSFLSFVSGNTTYESYRDAFVQLIMPQDKEDVEFSTGTNETLGMLDTFFSVVDGVSEFFLDELELDLMGDLKDTYDAVFGLVDAVATVNEVLDVEDQLELVAYFHAARESEESIIRALKEIMTETPGISNKMDSALQEVMTTYEAGDPLWVQVIDNLGKKTVGSVDNLLKELIPHSYLFDVGNELTNFCAGTGDQIEATTQAARFLDIQTCCQQVFDEVLPSYKDAMGESKGQFLQIMYDVTNLYLMAGVKAQEAMAQLDDMKGPTAYSLKRLEQEQERMAQFSEADIRFYANICAAEDWLLSLKAAPETAKDMGTPKQQSMDALTDMPTFITITWESEVDGKPMDMTANITGTLDDGTTVYRAPTEGEYITNSGRVATHSYYGKWIDLEVLRNDAVLDVVVEYGNVMPFDAPSYAEANVDIHIYNPLGTIAVIAANPAESAFAGSPYLLDIEYFLHRGATGVYFFTFQLDHGSLKGIHNPEAPAEPVYEQEPKAPTEPPAAPELLQKNWVAKKSGDRLIEYYTLDGQLQSSERYNPDGYKLESRWYDNGVCTAYTYWTYNEHNHLTRIRYMNVMEPDIVQMDFQNTYSGGKLQKVALYNVAGTLLGEGATAADAADAVGMRMLVEESLPK